MKLRTRIQAVAGQTMFAASLPLLLSICAQQCCAQTGPAEAGRGIHQELQMPFASVELDFVQSDLMDGKIADAVAGLEQAGAKGNGDGWAEQIADGLFLLGKPKEARIYAERYRKSTPAYAYIPYLEVLYGCSHGVIDKQALGAARAYVAMELVLFGGIGGHDYRQPKAGVLARGGGLRGAEFIAYLAGSFRNPTNYLGVLMAQKAASLEPSSPLANCLLGALCTEWHHPKTGMRYLQLALTENPGKLAPLIKISLAEALKFARKEQPTPSP